MKAIYLTLCVACLGMAGKSLWAEDAGMPPPPSSGLSTPTADIAVPPAPPAPVAPPPAPVADPAASKASTEKAMHRIQSEAAHPMKKGTRLTHKAAKKLDRKPASKK